MHCERAEMTATLWNAGSRIFDSTITLNDYYLECGPPRGLGFFCPALLVLKRKQPAGASMLDSETSLTRCSTVTAMKQNIPHLSRGQSPHHS